MMMLKMKGWPLFLCWSACGVPSALQDSHHDVIVELFVIGANAVHTVHIVCSREEGMRVHLDAELVISHGTRIAGQLLALCHQIIESKIVHDTLHESTLDHNASRHSELCGEHNRHG